MYNLKPKAGERWCSFCFRFHHYSKFHNHIKRKKQDYCKIAYWAIDRFNIKSTNLEKIKK